ncbi:SMP-30/gluconolactonase/LRE family protein [Nocardioides acrostichi]|uniref:SMP-30/gluconolactonase/LRE family protein n=1 Tax=Nocardioides acrostichi TaxID=2784339 RepID=A0A930UZ62_9ACTN|nr:SMP-30/gluconolactonase/LRE family protein [Nocardioides acrostichi]MBF4160802.1 SMP-30/gluconolactonase/LRE family protein [Nocardioides acrostichi]
MTTTPNRRADELTLLHHGGKGLIEGPRYDSRLGLVFSDARRGGVYALDDHGDVSVLWPHRRGIGGIALHAAGGMVVSGRNLAYRDAGGGDTVVLVEQSPEQGLAGFNDLTVDSRGRVYVGSVAEVAVDGRADDPDRKAGCLYLIGTDGTAEVVADDIQLSNGVGLSPDGGTLYMSDSARGHVLCWDVDADSGRLSARRVFHSLTAGLPDGLAVDEHGHVWVTAARAGQVLELTPDGVLVSTIEVPSPMVTSVVFGGEDLTRLFIVTGAESPEDPHDALILSLELSVRGMQVPRAETPTRVGP